MMSPHKLELIEWLDHCSPMGSGWHTFSYVAEMTPMVVYTAGWVINDADGHIVVVATIDEDAGEVQGAMIILKNCIKDRKVLLDDADRDALSLSSPSPPKHPG